MHVSTMRNVDRYAGIPLCWAAGIWNSLFRKSSFLVEPKTILIIKFFGLGSVLLTGPLLSVLRDRYPSARIFYLTFVSNKEILDKLPFALDRLTISTSSLNLFLSDTLRILRKLRREHVDVIFDLEFFSKFSTLISFLARGSMVVGYELPTFWRRSNLTHPIPLNHSVHVTTVFLQQLQAVGIAHTGNLRLSPLAVTEDEGISMERKLGLAANGVEVIAININAGAMSLERRWDPQRFLDVVEQLVLQNPGRRFFFIGSSDERLYVQAAISSRPELASYTTNCAGVLTLGESLALLYRSRVLLTNDSGPMHLASAVGTPVVALFGPESPRFYGPLGEARIVYNKTKCSPCLNLYNAKLFVFPFHARCMEEISVDEVVNAVQSLLASPKVAHG